MQLFVFLHYHDYINVKLAGEACIWTHREFWTIEDFWGIYCHINRPNALKISTEFALFKVSKPLLDAWLT